VVKTWNFFRRTVKTWQIILSSGFSSPQLLTNFLNLFLLFSEANASLNPERLDSEQLTFDSEVMP
jgi:hypothetical protein